MEETVNIATYILDDDQDILDIVEEMISKLGITNYKLFTDEQLFLDGLTEEIHVVIVDHFLNESTGLDIVKMIKDKNEDSYVIVYSGMRDHENIIKYINSGVDGWVDKNAPDHLNDLCTYLKQGLKTAKKKIDLYAFVKEDRQKRQNDNQ